MPELVHEQDLAVLNPTREPIHASHSTSHPHPHHVQRLKDAVTHCPTHHHMVTAFISGLSRCTVQRDNPEMERCCQRQHLLVSEDDDGGLSNAMPE